MAKFVDSVSIHAKAGNGGHGSVSIHREKFKPLGGPDGGNGGAGGSVVLKASKDIHTLLDFHFKSELKAKNGKPGEGNNKTGASADDVVLLVPIGTVVLDENNNFITDLVMQNQEFVLVEGGRGGLGNAALVSKNRKAPGFALLGEIGEEDSFKLELKSVADVGLIGFPSAGKSSLVSVMSKAKPEIADYPFTTLKPNLGVVSAGNTSFTVADVPGLIVGAADGKGLGIEFLKHIERCAVLVHVVDTAVLDSTRNPFDDIAAIENELAEYEKKYNQDWVHKLVTKPRVVALNKMDSEISEDMVKIQLEDLKKYDWPIFQISALTKKGIKEFIFELAKIVEQFRIDNPLIVPEASVLKIIEPEDQTFKIVKSKQFDNEFTVTGKKPLKWVKQTQFDNDEAVGFLADRLAKLGVEIELKKIGAQPGDTINIGDFSFEWQPDILAGDDFVPTNRGEDNRLDRSDRVAARERRILKKQRRNN